MDHSDKVRQIIASLKSRNITVSGGATHGKYGKFCCNAWFSDGRDPQCVYGETPDDAVHTLVGANRDEWSGLFGE
jgi:hypothetical protein